MGPVIGRGVWAAAAVAALAWWVPPRVAHACSHPLPGTPEAWLVWPAAGAIEVALDVELVVNVVAAGQPAPTFSLRGGGTLAAVDATDLGGSTATEVPVHAWRLRPLAPLAPMTTYTLDVAFGEGVPDAGVGMGAFTTGIGPASDQPPPAPIATIDVGPRSDCTPGDPLLHCCYGRVVAAARIEVTGASPALRYDLHGPAGELLVAGAPAPLDGVITCERADEFRRFVGRTQPLPWQGVFTTDADLTLVARDAAGRTSEPTVLHVNAPCDAVDEPTGPLDPLPPAGAGTSAGCALARGASSGDGWWLAALAVTGWWSWRRRCAA